MNALSPATASLAMLLGLSKKNPIPLVPNDVCAKPLTLTLYEG